MTTYHLDRRLAALGAGDRVCLSRRECEALFPPGIGTAAGRQAMYGLANTRGCDVHWADCEIAFVKR